MPDILALLTCLIVEIDNTTYRQFSHIISAMLATRYRITMKGISRWAPNWRKLSNGTTVFLSSSQLANNDVAVLSHSLFFVTRNLCHCR